MKDKLAPVSPLFSQYVDALRAAAQLGPVVDLACGRGRHALAAAAKGLPIVALDRDADFLRALAAHDAPDAQGARHILRVRADLETAHGLPFASGSCGAILVFRFLFRPLCAAIETALAPGGLLLYETFTRAQRTLGTGPTNPLFLLEPGELPSLFPGLTVLSHTEGWNDAPGRPGDPPTSATARLAAMRPAR